jgi:hypothetical protein
MYANIKTTKINISYKNVRSNVLKTFLDIIDLYCYCIFPRCIHVTHIYLSYLGEVTSLRGQQYKTYVTTHCYICNISLSVIYALPF